MKYAHQFSNKRTPQTQRVPNRPEQVKNHEGGYVFALSDMDRVRRFLILGSEAGSFYVRSSRELTVENATTLVKAIKENGSKIVDLIVEVSDKGLAAKNDPAIFALSLCMSEAYADLETRRKAALALPKVCRIGTHIFQFAEAVKAARGWGRLARRAIASWYTEKEVRSLEYQVSKYQSRTTVEGKKNSAWSHCDLLRKTHATPANPDMNMLFKYITSGNMPEEAVNLHFIEAVEQVKRCTNVKEMVSLIEKHKLPREVIPTKFLKDRKVLLAMLPHMPMTALVRNLGNLSANGILVDGAWDEINLVKSKLTNKELIRKSRIHPIQALAALMTYSQGHGFRGGNSWHPVGRVTSALDELFELSFHNVESTGKRTMLALDVSGSMGWTESTIPSLGITARDASAAMAMINFRKEENSFVFAFSNQFERISVQEKDSIQNVIRKVSNLNFGGTDCSLPMVYAMKNRINIDTFVVYTDSETYAGRLHPFQALNEYRQKSGIPAKLVVVGMVSNGFTIADPRDPGMLDVVGFDSSAPSIISSFSKGEI